MQSVARDVGVGGRFGRVPSEVSSRPPAPVQVVPDIHQARGVRRQRRRGAQDVLSACKVRRRRARARALCMFTRCGLLLVRHEGLRVAPTEYHNLQKIPAAAVVAQSHLFGRVSSRRHKVWCANPQDSDKVKL